MARQRPIHFKAFGDFLVGLRDARGWTQSEAADLARRRGLKALTRQVLLRLENGQTKNPEADVMRAVAALYGRDYQDVVSRFVGVRYGLGRDLGSQSPDQESNLLAEGGSTYVPASVAELEARLLTVERERDDYLALFNQMQDAASRLVKIAVAARRAKGRAAARTQRRRSGSDRKAS